MSASKGPMYTNTGRVCEDGGWRCGDGDVMRGRRWRWRCEDEGGEWKCEDEGWGGEDEM